MRRYQVTFQIDVQDASNPAWEQTFLNRFQGTGLLAPGETVSLISFSELPTPDEELPPPAPEPTPTPAPSPSEEV